MTVEMSGWSCLSASGVEVQSERLVRGGFSLTQLYRSFLKGGFFTPVSRRVLGDHP
jgi:hypothetical protein